MILSHQHTRHHKTECLHGALFVGLGCQARVTYFQQLVNMRVLGKAGLERRVDVACSANARWQRGVRTVDKWRSADSCNFNGSAVRLCRQHLTKAQN